ncbi:MAG: hypothetical protein ABL998_15515, partial [Planctomycetota bacterium]
MTGQELAAKLRDIGFTQIKSHMTALDDVEVLEIQARLEAYGIVGESASRTENVGGVKIKRKHKVATSEPTEEPKAPEPIAPVEPAPVPAAIPAAKVEPAKPPPVEPPPPARPRARAG